MNILKKQKATSQFSVVLCPKMSLNSFVTMEDRMEHFDILHGSFALGRVIQITNQRKNVHEDVIEYDNKHDNTDGWVTHLPRTFVV